MKLVLGALALSMVAACSSTVTGTGQSSSSSSSGGGSSGSSGTSGAPASPAQSCRDVIQAFLDSVQRCAETATFEELESAATDGQGCEAVTAIQNEARLRNECIPALRTIPCESISGALPPSCTGQLLTP